MELPEGLVLTEDLEPGDIGELISLQSKYYFEEFGYGIEFEAYISKLFSEYILRKDDGEKLWVLKREDKIMGSVALFREEGKRARLRLLFIHPEIRGKGIGNELVEKAIGFAREMGYTSIVLMTEDILESAVNIYKKTGFSLISSEHQNMWGTDCELQSYEKDL
jgi:N-acetylglutamate synthase-like GNAT family acetyltransferase